MEIWRIRAYGIRRWNWFDHKERLAKIFPPFIFTTLEEVNNLYQIDKIPCYWQGVNYYSCTDEITATTSFSKN